MTILLGEIKLHTVALIVLRFIEKSDNAILLIKLHHHGRGNEEEVQGLLQVGKGFNHQYKSTWWYSGYSNGYPKSGQRYHGLIRDDPDVDLFTNPDLGLQ